MTRFVYVGFFLACAAAPVFAQNADTNPFIGDSTAITQGKDIYGKNCTSCHGPDGSAGEIGPAIVPAERTEARVSDEPILRVIRNGVQGTVMPAFAGKLSSDDIFRVAAYLHALRGTAIDDPLPGDATNGEAVFWGKGRCGDCHMIRGRGGLTAPDLTNIAGTRKSVSIIDALTKAQHHVYGEGGSHLESLSPLDTWLPVQVTTDEGKNIDGVLMNEDSYALQVMGNDRQLHMLDRASLRKIEIGSRSLMPTDYDKRLGQSEFRDLLAFLTRQSPAYERSTEKPAGNR